jgi:hypothetical protein
MEHGGFDLGLDAVMAGNGLERKEILKMLS